jgi:hypothetical protein
MSQSELIISSIITRMKQGTFEKAESAHDEMLKRIRAFVERMDKSFPSVKTKWMNPVRIADEEALYRASSM